MKKCRILLVPWCICEFAVGQEAKLLNYTFPLPEKFVEFADEAREDQGRDVSEFFKGYGISIPQGGKIAIDRAKVSLTVTLPPEQALRVVQVLNWCIVQSPARFFRGGVEQSGEAFAANVAKEEIPIPQSLADCNGITIHVESRSGDRIICLIVNNTDRPTWFNGWSLSSPTYRVQKLSGDRWIEHEITWDCGIGLGTEKLSSHRACRFDLELPKTALPVRIGISLLDDVSIQQTHNTVWTKPVKQTSEPANGNQPATQPADKASAKEQPSIPKSEDVPR